MSGTTTSGTPTGRSLGGVRAKLSRSSAAVRENQRGFLESEPFTTADEKQGATEDAAARAAERAAKLAALAEPVSPAAPAVPAKPTSADAPESAGAKKPVAKKTKPRTGKAGADLAEKLSIRAAMGTAGRKPRMTIPVSAETMATLEDCERLNFALHGRRLSRTALVDEAGARAVADPERYTPEPGLLPPNDTDLLTSRIDTDIHRGLVTVSFAAHPRQPIVALMRNSVTEVLDELHAELERQEASAKAETAD